MKDESEHSSFIPHPSSLFCTIMHQTYNESGACMELIVTHSRTDFDGLAAQLAAQKLYPRAIPVLNRRLRDNVAEFEALYHEHLPFVPEDDLPDEQVARLIVVDTPSAPGIPGLEDARVPTLIIDHHPRERAPLPNEELDHAEIGAITSLLVQRLITAQISLSSVEATLMLLGIYDDTGSLSFSTTTQADVAAAAWLLGQGARIEALGEFLRRPLSAEQERVLEQLTDSMKIEPIGGWTVLLASAQVKGDAPQLSSLADKLGDLYLPSVTALAISTGDHGTQIILRANPEALDVGSLARGFGGGGHPAAAAAYVRERSGNELLPELERAIRRAIQPSPTAADVMTRYVHSVSQDATVSQAEAVLARSGHGSLPVVDTNRIVHGLVTRRDLATAARHGRRDTPVTRYMWDDPPLVAPDTPLADLRREIAEAENARVGRLLVVDGERHLLGIIARSDLVEAIDGVADRDDARLAEEFERTLTAPLIDVLRRAAAIAEEHGSALYAVGGTVRDMLLQRAQGDLDLLVEGDAIGLADALVNEFGGEVTSHEQFGTATLELGEREKGRKGEQTSHARSASPLHPLTLDFVMARTEFYEAPATLPAVEAASLRHDLHRRDFTINTLAICLNPSRYGRLYDFYGGRRDIERKLIRVLHNLSFLDDPTRILRAARLAARLGFSIEARTRALIDDALEYDVLGRTTPQRIFNELRLVLNEAEPERVLGLLQEWGVLHALHPALGWSEAQAAQLRSARTAAFADASATHVALSIVVYPLTETERGEILARFQPPGTISALFADLDRVQAAITQLRAPDLANSALDRLLFGIGTTAMRAAELAEGGVVAERIDHYLAELRPTRTALNGDDLLRLGFTPGPGVGRALAELRAAKLDGLVQTREDEEAWVKQH